MQTDTLVVSPTKPMTVKTAIPFFVMAFGLSWGVAALAIVFADKLEPIFGPIGLTNPLFFIAVYAPAISGISLVLRHYGIVGLRSFAKRLTLWHMPQGWAIYLALGIPAVFYLGAWLKGSSLSFPFDPWYAVIPALLLMLVLGPMEEFGWRGVALPLLQRKFRPIGADLILSILWATWHLPAFFLSGTPQSQWSFPMFFIGVVSISWILTPLFNAAHGSILIAAIYHFQMNNPIWPDAQPYDSLLFALIAVLAVFVNRTAMFSRSAGVTSVLMPGDEEPCARRAAPAMSPRKPKTAVLTREQIVAAAVSLVDRDGLSSLSMRRLAAELGVGPMTLYYHVPDKFALEDLIFDAILGEVDFSADDPTLDPEERAVSMGYALRAALLAHPNTVPITLSRAARTPGQLRPVEVMLGILYDMGLDATDAIAAVDVVGQYVFGTTLAYVNQLAAEGKPSEVPEVGGGSMTAEQFPNLTRAIAESEYLGWDRMFDRGLRALVRGLIVERISRPSPPG